LYLRLAVKSIPADVQSDGFINKRALFFENVSRFKQDWAAEFLFAYLYYIYFSLLIDVAALME
jgi:hypothetical protein